MIGGKRRLPIRCACAGLLLCCLAGGCRSPEEKLDQSRRTLVSWAATLASVSGVWADGRAPDAYARQTSKSAGEQIRQEVRKIEREKSAASGSGTKLREAGIQVAAAARDLSEIVRRSDRDAARRLSAATSQLARSLSSEGP